MRQPLHQIADIRTGQTFRGRINNTPTGNVRVLQIKDIKACASIDEKALPRIRWIRSRQTGKLQAGDIIMPARGEYYNVTLYENEDENENKKERQSEIPVVATNQLFIIKTRTKEVMPEYLCWHMNQKVSQHYFKTHCSGTSIPMLNKDSLAALQIEIPPMQTQKKIVAMYQLWQQEKQLTEKLLDNREQMLNGIVQQLLKI